MHILYVEDENEKYMDVVRALRSGGCRVIERSRNLSDAKDKIRHASYGSSPYDLIITDMSYQNFEGGSIISNAGEQLLEFLKSEESIIPVVVVSSVRRAVEGSAGYVVYNARKSDWERELIQLVHSIVSK